MTPTAQKITQETKEKHTSYIQHFSNTENNVHLKNVGKRGGNTQLSIILYIYNYQFIIHLEFLEEKFKLKFKKLFDAVS